MDTFVELCKKLRFTSGQINEVEYLVDSYVCAYEKYLQMGANYYYHENEGYDSELEYEEDEPKSPAELETELDNLIENTFDDVIYLLYDFGLEEEQVYDIKASLEDYIKQKFRYDARLKKYGH